jgi:hypothetical protein
MYSPSVVAAIQRVQKDLTRLYREAQRGSRVEGVGHLNLGTGDRKPAV